VFCSRSNETVFHTVSDFASNSVISCWDGTAEIPPPPIKILSISAVNYFRSCPHGSCTPYSLQYVECALYKASDTAPLTLSVGHWTGRRSPEPRDIGRGDTGDVAHKHDGVSLLHGGVITRQVLYDCRRNCSRVFYTHTHTHTHTHNRVWSDCDVAVL